MTAGFFYAHTVAKAPSKDAKALCTHTTLPRARAVARRYSKLSLANAAYVMERDFETGKSTILEHWENGTLLLVKPVKPEKPEKKAKKVKA